MWRMSLSLAWLCARLTLAEDNPFGGHGGCGCGGNGVMTLPPSVLPAVCLFTRSNPSSVAPFAFLSASTAPGLAFAPLSAILLGHTFALCTSAVTVCHGIGTSERSGGSGGVWVAKWLVPHIFTVCPNFALSTPPPPIA